MQEHWSDRKLINNSGHCPMKIQTKSIHMEEQFLSSWSSRWLA